MDKRLMALAQNFNRYADQELRQLQGYPPLYEPYRYIFSIGGKRLRPLLCLLAAAGTEEPPDHAYAGALALELFHNFSLMHDDIMDEAAVRRGQPSVPARYGRDRAILSGDAMLITASQYLDRALSQLPVDSAQSLRADYHQMALDVCAGQQMDMDFEQRDDLALEEYIDMIAHKTAALIGYSLSLGHALSGGDPRGIQTYYQLGREAGIAFQIQDDYLDYYGAEQAVGKQRGGDLLRAKKSALTLVAWKLMSPADRHALQQLMTSTAPTEDRLPEIDALLAGYPIADELLTLRDSYRQSIEQRLTDLPRYNDVLATLIEALIIRDR